MVPRKKRNSSKINLIISIIFHSALTGLLFFFAAREGLVGKRMQALTATLAPKEKKPEPPKDKPAEPKVETPKVAATPRPAIAPPKAETAAAPPPASAAPAMAPALASLPSFEFNDGAKEVQSISDPDEIYKALIERSLHARWNRPENVADDNYVADVELSIDVAGRVTGSRWLKGSGNGPWDDSVKKALAETKTIGQPPPKGFPARFLVRFDVATMPADNALQFSSQ